MSKKSSRYSLFTQLGEQPKKGHHAPSCYTATTHGITVSVRTFWLEEHSDPEEQCYTWLYHITIHNKSTHNLQLLSRSWTTLDSNGHTENTQGLGILGEQPLIAAHGQYEYTSGVEIRTPSGFMKGLYHMLSPHNRKHIDITIPTCSLDSPHHGGLIH